MRSTNGSRGAGAAARTASITLSNACGPVIAEHLGKALADRLWLRPHAARHDHLAVLGERGADRLERFGLGAVEEAASVDDDSNRRPHGDASKRIAFGAQLRDDAFRVHERLRAAERDERNARRGMSRAFWFCVHRLPLAWAGGRRQASGSHAAAPIASSATRSMSRSVPTEGDTAPQTGAAAQEHAMKAPAG